MVWGCHIVGCGPTHVIGPLGDEVRLPFALRGGVKWATRGLTILGVVFGFMSLPPALAGGLSVLLLLGQLALERLGFYRQFLHVSPMPSGRLTEQKLGSVWLADKEKYLVFGQLFSTRTSACECFRLFRYWTFGKYNDTEGCIRLSAIREELDRYTILLDPGDRGLKEYYDDYVFDEHGDKVEARLMVMAAWFGTYADYWDRPESKRFVESLAKGDVVLLNAYHLEDDRPIAAAKKYIQLSQVSLVDRADVRPGSIEDLVKWRDPWTGVPAEIRRRYDGVWGDREIDAEDD